MALLLSVSVDLSSVVSEAKPFEACMAVLMYRQRKEVLSVGCIATE
jgi:hypothetical protein